MSILFASSMFSKCPARCEWVSVPEEWFNECETCRRLKDIVFCHFDVYCKDVSWKVVDAKMWGFRTSSVAVEASFKVPEYELVATFVFSVASPVTLHIVLVAPLRVSS